MNEVALVKFAIYMLPSISGYSSKMPCRHAFLSDDCGIISPLQWFYLTRHSVTSQMAASLEEPGALYTSLTPTDCWWFETAPRYVLSVREKASTRARRHSHPSRCSCSICRRVQREFFSLSSFLSPSKQPFMSDRILDRNPS